MYYRVYNNVVKSSQLAPGSNFHLFLKGVQPMWEDPANVDGGKWIAQVLRAKKKELDNYWLNTVRFFDLLEKLHYFFTFF